MPNSKLGIEERQDGDITIVTLTGQMLVDDGDLAFRKCIHDLVDRGRFRVLVDLGGVTYIDSSGIGMLAAKLKTLREHGGDLRLLHLSSKSQRLFGMLKLRTMFETFDDEAMAIRSFARPGL
jgi:anti-sigma B factor antagonist